MEAHTRLSVKGHQKEENPRAQRSFHWSSRHLSEQLQTRRREDTSRLEPWPQLDHNFTFGGSLPSIVINEDSASDRSSAASLLVRWKGGVRAF